MTARTRKNDQHEPEAVDVPREDAAEFSTGGLTFAEAIAAEQAAEQARAEEDDAA